MMNEEQLLQDVARNTADINKLTANISELAKTVTRQSTQTADAISSLAEQQHKGHEELLHHINKQAVTVAGANKTNWQTIATICGVFVAVTTFAVTLLIIYGNMTVAPIQRDLHRVEDWSERNRVKVEEIQIVNRELQEENKTLYILMNLGRKESNQQPVDVKIEK